MTDSSITVECRKCGHAFIVPRVLIITGNWQRGCPVCHPPRAVDAPHLDTYLPEPDPSKDGGTHER